MYNEEQKIGFIRDYTDKANTAKFAERVFARMEPYEKEWQADLCTRSAEELASAVEEISTIRASSQFTSINVLREYARWCLRKNKPGACDGMLHVSVVGLEKIRSRMVANPLHLQSCLDKLFHPEIENRIDNLYRCYFWMVYGGIKEADTVLVRESDVDFAEMRIKYGDTSAPIYREAIPSFRNAVGLTSFLYEHPGYGKPIQRDRVPGDTIMRGVKADAKIMTIRSTLSKHIADMVNQGKVDVKLSYYRVWLSGVFYRMYEYERAGGEVNFSGIAAEAMVGKTYVVNGINKRITKEHKQNQKKKDYMEDYQRWKLAFAI